MQEQMFKTADKNGDGTISSEELSQTAQSGSSQDSTSSNEMFSQLDSNSDGAISRLESDAAIAKAGQQMQAQGTPPQGPPPSEGSDSSSSDSTDATAIFDAMDTNEDGTVSLEELTAALDKSKDSSTTSSDPKSLLENLSKALQSGNVSDAQTAIAALQEDIASRNGGQSNDPFGKDLQSLSDSLESGNLSDAQNIFAGIQEKLAAGPPDKPAAEKALSQVDSSNDTMAKTLQTLLDAIDKSSTSSVSSTASASDSSANLKNIIKIALQSYAQQSLNGFEQNSANGTTLSASA
jgi:Ca2+-binding EF-hand superfamily protein